jgi:transcriptional regulator
MRRAGRSPGQSTDAPADYVEGLTRGFVGLRLSITRVTAKAKLNQTSAPADHAGVVAGLSASSDPLDRAVAERMRLATKAPAP